MYSAGPDHSPGKCGVRESSLKQFGWVRNNSVFDFRYYDVLDTKPANPPLQPEGRETVASVLRQAMHACCWGVAAALTSPPREWHAWTKRRSHRIKSGELLRSLLICRQLCASLLMHDFSDELAYFAASWRGSVCCCSLEPVPA